MNRTSIGVIGILLTVIFIAGFFVLFIVNPQTLEEVNNVSLTFYNLEGMNGRMWAVFAIYLTVGVLNVLFSILLFVATENTPVMVVGKALLLVSGIVWLSFGLFPYDANTDLGVNLMLVRIIIIILTGSLGLIVLGAEFERISKSRFLKWQTLSSGFLVLFLSIVSVFLYDNTWIRTNASFVIYFTWFGVFGLVYLRQSDSV